MGTSIYILFRSLFRVLESGDHDRHIQRGSLCHFCKRQRWGAACIYSKNRVVIAKIWFYELQVLTPVTVTQTFSQIIEAQQSTATKIAYVLFYWICEHGR